MIKTTKTEEVKQTERKEFDLKEAFVLWENNGIKGNKYLKGFTSKELDNMTLVGFYNTNKKNPKEPDIRVCTVNKDGKADKEVASLWENIGKNENRYLTGTTDEKEKLVGWYNNGSNEKAPYIRVYFSKNEE